MSNNGQKNTEPEVNMPVQALTEQTLAVDLARAEIDQAIATAHRYPRMLDTVIKKIETLACYNEQAAENCIYSLPRAGKAIIGPSVSFANIVAQAWGNCTDGARITYIDRKEKVVIAEGGFHDLETNRKTVLPVQRRIVDKQGRIFNDDMIMVTGMAAASIARRNAILNAIPRAIWFPIYERCLQIVRGDVETFSERKDKALKAFAQFGVKPEQVYMVLGLKGEADLTLEHLPTLRGMYSALRNQESTVEEMFDPRRMTGTGFETVSNPLGEEPGAEIAEEIVDKETGEIKAKPERRRRPRKAKEPYGVSESEKVIPEARAVSEHTAKVIEEMPPPSPEVELAQAQHEAIEAARAETPMQANLPHNADEYRHHLATWLMAATDPAEIEKQWRTERNMRGNAGVIEDHFVKAQALKDERINQLA